MKKENTHNSDSKRNNVSFGILFLTNVCVILKNVKSFIKVEKFCKLLLFIMYDELYCSHKRVSPQFNLILYLSSDKIC